MARRSRKQAAAVHSSARRQPPLRAPWVALYVETPSALRLTEAERDRKAKLAPPPTFITTP